MLTSALAQIKPPFYYWTFYVNGLERFRAYTSALNLKLINRIYPVE